jgi:hypothetical protein
MRDPAFDFGRNVVVIQLFETDSLARRIFRTDAERQCTRLATFGNQLFGDTEVAFAQAMALEDVTPAARADGMTGFAGSAHRSWQAVLDIGLRPPRSGDHDRA